MYSPGPWSERTLKDSSRPSSRASCRTRGKPCSNDWRTSPPGPGATSARRRHCQVRKARRGRSMAVIERGAFRVRTDRIDKSAIETRTRTSCAGIGSSNANRSVHERKRPLRGSRRRSRGSCSSRVEKEGHLSGTAVSRSLAAAYPGQPRAVRTTPRSCLALLRTGLPCRLRRRKTRWALTPPFHLYRPTGRPSPGLARGFPGTQPAPVPLGTFHRLAASGNYPASRPGGSSATFLGRRLADRDPLALPGRGRQPVEGEPDSKLVAFCMASRRSTKSLHPRRSLSDPLSASLRNGDDRTHAGEAARLQNGRLTD